MEADQGIRAEIAAARAEARAIRQRLGEAQWWEQAALLTALAALAERLEGVHRAQDRARRVAALARRRVKSQRGQRRTPDRAAPEAAT